MNLKISPVAASVIFAAAAAMLMSIVTILPLRPIPRTTASECGDLPVPGGLLGVSRPVERSKPASPFCPAFYAGSRNGRCRFRHRFRGPGRSRPVLGPQRNLLPGTTAAACVRRSDHLRGRPRPGPAAAAAGPLRLTAQHMDVLSHPGAVLRGGRRRESPARPEPPIREKIEKRTAGPTFFSESKNWKGPSRSWVCNEDGSC